MKDHVMDHLRKLGEHPIFFDVKKYILNFFYYINFRFPIIFSKIFGHEMNIRFYLMFYVLIWKKTLNDTKERKWIYLFEWKLSTW